MLPGLQAIDSVHNTIQQSLGSVRSALGYLQMQLADRLASAQLQWSATVAVADVARQAALYALYALLIGAVVLLTLGIGLNCPSLAKPALIVALILAIVCWALVGADTAALKVGFDG